MKIYFLIVFALSLYKQGVLIKHHINDDNILAVITDCFSLVLIAGAAVLMYFLF